MSSNNSCTTSHATSGWPSNTVGNLEALHLRPSNDFVSASNCANRFSTFSEPSLQAGSKVGTTKTSIGTVHLAGKQLENILRCRSIDMSGSVGSLASVWRKRMPEWQHFSENLPQRFRTGAMKRRVCCPNLEVIQDFMIPSASKPSTSVQNDGVSTMTTLSWPCSNWHFHASTSVVHGW